MKTTKGNFHWQRYEITKERREWTPRRIQAAARAVEREADKMALFPGLRHFRTVEQRMEQMDRRTDRMTRALRAGRAKLWREARDYIRRLPPDAKKRLLEKWNTGYMPGGPADLFATARLIGLNPPNPFIQPKQKDHKP